jgi:hypothetical protein
MSSVDAWELGLDRHGETRATWILVEVGISGA